MIVSIEAIIPAAAAVAVSFAGFLYARYITARYDEQTRAERADGSEGDPVVTVDLAEVEKALSSEGVNASRLSEVLRDARHRKIEIPVAHASR